LLGLNIYSQSEWEHLTVENGLVTNNITDLEDSEDDLWFATSIRFMLVQRDVLNLSEGNAN